MSYPETAGGDHPDARTRAWHPGAAPEPVVPEYRNGRPAAERPDPYGRPAAEQSDPYGDATGTALGGAVPGVPGRGASARSGGPAPSGPYTGTGEFPHAGSRHGADGGWSLTGHPPAASPPQWPGGAAAGLSPAYVDPLVAAEPPAPEEPATPAVPAEPAAPDAPTELLPRAEPESPARQRAGARRRRAGRGSAAPAKPPVDRPDLEGQSAGPQPTPPAGSGRAGRNLPAAIGVGVGLAAVVLGSLLVWRPAFLVVLVAAISLGTWEVARAVRSSGARPPLPPLLVGGVLMAVLAWQVGPDALALGLLLTVLAMLIWRLGDGPPGYQRDVATATLIAVYVPFLGGFAALLASRPDGHLQILVTLAAVILSDTGGYAAGVFLGRHPMAPTVSPKKSWEGFAGSVAAAAAGSALLLYLLLDVDPLWGAVFGVAVSVAATLGDLGESMIKRDLRVKDMSNLLPGHGGLMDRLDSILFALPVSYLVLTLIGPAG